MFSSWEDLFTGFLAGMFIAWVAGLVSSNILLGACVIYTVARGVQAARKHANQGDRE